MKITLKSICNRQLDTKPNSYSDENESKKKRNDPQHWREFLAFWILGLTTEFGYVVIVCAAHDILHGFGQSSNVISVCFFLCKLDGIFAMKFQIFRQMNQKSHIQGLTMQSEYVERFVKHHQQVFFY